MAPTHHKGSIALAIFAAGFFAASPSIAIVKPRGFSPQADISNPGVFIAVTPCRQYDSRNFTPLLSGTSRAITLTGAPCGLPNLIAAVSVNISVFNITASSNGVFTVGIPSGTSIAFVNYAPSQGQIDNAGSIPVNTSGQISVSVNQGSGSVDFVVDVNGYYIDQAGTLNTGEYLGIYGTYNPFLGVPGGVLYAQNYSSGVAYSINTSINNTSTFAAALNATQTATSGANYAVRAKNSSTGAPSAAVLASAGVDLPAGALGGNGTAGVRGYASGGVFNVGVLGLGTTEGVFGARVDSTSGSTLVYGVLGSISSDGVYAGGDISASGTKFFVEPHPTDPTKVIKYASLEGPEAGTYFRGRGRFQRGLAVLEVPEHFRMVTDPESLSVQITPIGEMATVAVLRIDLDRIVVQGSRNVDFFYTVNGVRKAFRDLAPVQADLANYFEPRSADERMPAYLSAEAKARLIANGTYREDGTVNLETAERVGWAAKWREREARIRAQQNSSAEPDPQTSAPGAIPVR